MAAADLFEGARNAFDNLNERERKLVGALGVVAAAIFLLLPVYLMTASISDLEAENQKIATVLRDIARARPQLAEREAERQAAQALYDQQAPPLGGFVEAKARDQELALREATDQPDQVLGQYTRRAVRASLPNVGLRAVVKMFTSIENSNYPVAIDRIQIEHFRSGDQYNVTFGVVAYANNTRTAAQDDDAPAAPSKRTKGRAGPPSPR